MVEEYPTKSSDSARLKEIKDEIKTIGDRSTWLLGFLTIIVAGLTSFVFQGLDAIIAESNFPSLKPATLGLLIHYLAITFLILFVQLTGFLILDDEIKIQKNRVEVNRKKLKIIKGAYKTAVIFAITSLFLVCGFAINFSYI